MAFRRVMHVGAVVTTLSAVPKVFSHDFDLYPRKGLYDMLILICNERTINK